MTKPFNLHSTLRSVLIRTSSSPRVLSPDSSWLHHSLIGQWKWRLKTMYMRNLVSFDLNSMLCELQTSPIFPSLIALCSAQPYHPCRRLPQQFESCTQSPSSGRSIEGSRPLGTPRSSLFTTITPGPNNATKFSPSPPTTSSGRISLQMKYSEARTQDSESSPVSI